MEIAMAGFRTGAFHHSYTGWPSALQETSLQRRNNRPAVWHRFLRLYRWSPPTCRPRPPNIWRPPSIWRRAGAADLPVFCYRSPNHSSL